MRYLIIFFTFSSRCFSQIDSTDIYYESMKKYILEIDKYNLPKSDLFIEEITGITYKIPKVIENKNVVILTSKNIREVYKRQNNKLRHIKIFPAKIVKDLIEIQITPFFGEYRGLRKRLYLSLSNWVIIQFKFDCNENKFKYFQTKHGGI